MKKFSFPKLKDVNYISQFVTRRKKKDTGRLKKDAMQWTRTAWENKMDYEINWFGVPIIQNPYDMILMQELIFETQPDIIIETGVAHGGSLIYYSSLLALLNKGHVFGIDIDIRKHNRKYIENHPMIKRVTLIEGDSIAEDTLKQVRKKIKPGDKVMVILDSDHRKEHVYNELLAYSGLVTKGSYMVVFDTFMPFLVGLKGSTNDFKTNSAMDAVKLFLRRCKQFQIDKSRNKFYVSSSPNGFLVKTS